MAQAILRDYKNNLFSNHFLEDRIQELDEWQETEIEITARNMPNKIDFLLDLADARRGRVSLIYGFEYEGQIINGRL